MSPAAAPNVTETCREVYHFDRLIAQMKAERAERPPEADSGPQVASVAAAGEAAA
jgi:hypothetical protein